MSCWYNFYCIILAGCIDFRILNKDIIEQQWKLLSEVEESRGGGMEEKSEIQAQVDRPSAWRFEREWVEEGWPNRQKQVKNKTAAKQRHVGLGENRVKNIIRHECIHFYAFFHKTIEQYLNILAAIA